MDLIHLGGRGYNDLITISEKSTFNRKSWHAKVEKLSLLLQKLLQLLFFHTFLLKNIKLNKHKITEAMSKRILQKWNVQEYKWLLHNLNKLKQDKTNLNIEKQITDVIIFLRNMWSMNWIIFLKIHYKSILNSLLHFWVNRTYPRKENEITTSLDFIKFGHTILQFGFHVLTIIQNPLPLFQTPDQSCHM